MRSIDRRSGQWGSLAGWVLGLQIVASELKVAVLGVPELVNSAFTWGVKAPLLVLPVAFIGLRSDVLRRGAMLFPQSAALVWLAWGTLTMFWAPDLISSAQVSLSTLGLWITGAWFVMTFGFVRFARVYTSVTVVFMVAGLLHDLFFRAVRRAWLSTPTPLADSQA